MRLRTPIIGLLFASLFLSLGSAAALAHSYFYSFPYYPLDTYVGDSDHYHKHWANPAGPDDYYARYNSEVRQTTVGSFDWLSFKTGPGAHLNGKGWNGWSTVVGPVGEIFRFGNFNCDEVIFSVEMWPTPFVWNPRDQGYWRQENGGGGSCMSAYLTYDNIAVTSIR